MPVSDALRKELVRNHRFGSDMVDISFRAGFKCEYCSTDMLGSVDAYEWNWEREHIIPTSADGPDVLDNWAMSCRVCNQLKGKWDPRTRCGDSPGRDDLVVASRAYVQELRVERQAELTKVRSLIAAEARS
jgi:5-methylcytosine-specific restriction endonuclease McrA